MSKIIRLLAMLLAFVCLSMSMTSCGSDNDDEPDGDISVVGKWKLSAPFPTPDWDEDDWMTLTADGKFQIETSEYEEEYIHTVASGTYTVKNDILTLSGNDDDGEPMTKVCHIEDLTKDRMVLRITMKDEDGEFTYNENWTRIK